MLRVHQMERCVTVRNASSLRHKMFTSVACNFVALNRRTICSRHTPFLSDAAPILKKILSKLPQLRPLRTRRQIEAEHLEEIQ